MTEIPLRMLRNETSRVLRRVEAGERLTVTVRGRPVADLVPHAARRRLVPREELARFLASRRPSRSLRADVRRAIPDSTDDV